MQAAILKFHAPRLGGHMMPCITRRLIWNRAMSSKQARPSAAVNCSAASCETVEPAMARRSENCIDCVWEPDFIRHAMRSQCNDVGFKNEAEEMKREIREMLHKVSTRTITEQLELIDDLQRLGLSYHFKQQIKSMLDKIYCTGLKPSEIDLHNAALAFRLFRQNGHPITEGIFWCFLDRAGRFNMSLSEDVKGMISLYEASFLAMEGDTIMNQARNFSTAHLKKTDDPYLGALLCHALEMPLHWRTERAEARWFMEVAYEKKPNMSHRLLQFAKLDYNIVQGIYQEELRDLSKWWESLRLKEGLGSAGDCLVESHLWGIHICPDPQYSACRKAFAKTIALVCTADYYCDIFATMEEVELLTNTFARWDIDSIHQLPQYMKKCYLACYNTVNQMAYEVLVEKGFDVTQVFKTAWAKLTRVYLKEARWFHSGYKPTLEEYLKDAWISLGSPLAAIHAQAFDPNPVTNIGVELKYLQSDPDIFKCTAMIMRLNDDLETASAQGDNLNAVQCYMRDTGASEEAAWEKIKEMMMEGWKKLNTCKIEERRLQSAGVERLMNLARASHCFYLHGNEHEDGVEEKRPNFSCPN